MYRFFARRVCEPIDALRSLGGPRGEARDRRIKSLTTENKNLKVKLAILKRQFEDGLATAGGMSFETLGAIAKGLHPDRQPSEAERASALKLFTAWKADKDKARRRAKS